MKKKLRTCDYLKSRNDSLRSVFKNCLGHGGKCVKDVFQEMEKVPAPRFYISEERAYSLVCTKERPNKRRVPSRLAMINEIRKRCDMLRQQCPDLTLKDAVFQVVNSPAPSFYLTVSSIRTIIYKNYRA